MAARNGRVRRLNVNRTVPLTWHELDWLRNLTGLPLVLKGIRTAEDAHIAAESGVDGIWYRLTAGVNWT